MRPEFYTTTLFLGTKFVHVFDFSFTHYKKGEAPNKYYRGLLFGFYYWFQYKKRDR